MAELIQGYTEGDCALATALQEKGPLKGQKLAFFIECVRGRITSKDVEIRPVHIMQVIKESLSAGLDPSGSDIYAFLMKDKRGEEHLTLGVTIDGWARLLDNRNCSFRFESLSRAKIRDRTFDSELKCIITKPGGASSEWVTSYAEARTSNPLWVEQPQQMMQVRALARCARVAVAMGAIYELDEAKAWFEHPENRPSVAPRVVVEEEKKQESALALPEKTGAEDGGMAELQAELEKVRACKTRDEARKVFAASPLRTNTEFVKEATLIAKDLEN